VKLSKLYNSSINNVRDLFSQSYKLSWSGAIKYSFIIFTVILILDSLAYIATVVSCFVKLRWTRQTHTLRSLYN
jgi:hypothetical protein